MDHLGNDSHLNAIARPQLETHDLITEVVKNLVSKKLLNSLYTTLVSVQRGSTLRWSLF